MLEAQIYLSLFVYVFDVKSVSRIPRDRKECWEEEKVLQCNGDYGHEEPWFDYKEKVQVLSWLSLQLLIQLKKHRYKIIYLVESDEPFIYDSYVNKEVSWEAFLEEVGKTVWIYSKSKISLLP